jgi:hypothetical protein
MASTFEAAILQHLIRSSSSETLVLVPLCSYVSPILAA